MYFTAHIATNIVMSLGISPTDLDARSRFSQIETAEATEVTVDLII
jgi:hypothetical protein